MDWQIQREGLAKGDRKAQQMIFRQYGKAMYQLCRRYISPPEDAEEALMNGFMKLYRHNGRGEFADEAAFAGWMRRIMVNECLMMLRSRNSMLRVADAPEVIDGHDYGPENSLSAKELFLLLEQLPVGYRTVFNLYVVEGFTHKEIANCLEISEGSSKSQLSKARKLLAQLWKKENEYYALGKAR